MSQGSRGRGRGAVGVLIRLTATATLTACSLLSPDHDAAVSVSWTRPLGPSEGGWLGRAGIAQQTVFTQAGGRLDALDLRTGAVRWRRQVRTSLPINAENVVVEAGLVVVAGGDSVRAFDAASGTPQWSHLPDANVASCAIAAANGMVVVGSRAPAVTSLSLATGQVLWRTPLGSWPFEAIITGASISGDTVYAAVIQYLSQNGFFRTGHVVALSATTGAELWRYTTPGDSTDVAAAPVVTPTSLLIGDIYGRSFFALDRFTGQLRWRVRTARGFPGVHHGPVVRDGVVFAAAQGGVYAVEEVTGVARWTREDLLAGRDLAWCGNVLLVQALRIEALDPATGRTLDTVLNPEGTEVVTSALAVAGSRGFVSGYDGMYGLACR
jgi:outer membrane protein assembly factor BamB